MKSLKKDLLDVKIYETRSEMGKAAAADIKACKPENNSICSGQVLQHPYTADKARLVLREMADMLSLDLVEKGLVTNQLVLTVGYDIENLSDPGRRAEYKGEVVTDHYAGLYPRVPTVQGIWGNTPPPQRRYSMLQQSFMTVSLTIPFWCAAFI